MSSHIYKTEEEQIDDLKRWIKSYGPSILIGIVLAILIIYGWRLWTDHQHKRAVNASVLYQQAVDAYQTKHQDLLDKSINILQDKYPHSPYTQYALFIQAKIAADKQDYNAAEISLSWVTQHARDSNIKSIAQLRLGSIQMAEHKEEIAIETLKKIKNPAFKGLADIKIADAYLALENTQQAKEYYDAANKLLPDAGNTMPTLAMKLDNASTSS